ncbi:MAG: PilN domain-containing protein [Burkholderiaceae bacterium]|nr:PilN domain-containing protein [Burkholderiaceae bacterium]
MILINLLPHREEKRAARKRAFFVALGVAAVVGAVVVGIWYSVLQQLTAAQQARNTFLKTEITKLEAQIKDIANLRNEIEALKARQRAVEDLQTNRNIPVYLLDELVKQTPEGIYLKDIKQNGSVVTIAGIAQTNERVSEFLRNTQYNSKWLERPELVEIRAVNMQTARSEQRRLFDFSMRVTLKRPAPPAPATPNAPVPAAAAAKSA